MRTPERDACDGQTDAHQTRDHLDVALSTRLLLGRAPKQAMTGTGEVVEVVIVGLVVGPVAFRNRASRIAARFAGREKLVMHVFDRTSVRRGFEGSFRGGLVVMLGFRLEFCFGSDGRKLGKRLRS